MVLQATEAPALTTGAATIALAPSFLSSYATQTNDFITAVGNLPASGSNPGAADPNVTPLGELPVLPMPVRSAQRQLSFDTLMLVTMVNTTTAPTTTAEYVAASVSVRVGRQFRMRAPALLFRDSISASTDFDKGL